MPQTPAIWQAPVLGVSASRPGAESDTHIVPLAGGDYMVVYRLNTSADGNDVFSQRYDRFGEPVGAAVRIQTGVVSNSQVAPELTAMPDGGYVVVYSDTDAVGTSIKLVRYNASGVAQGGIITVASDTSAGDPTFGQPAVALTSMTLGLVVFERMVGDQTSISARTYNPTTNALGPEVTVLSSSLGVHSDPSVVTLQDGSFVVVANTAAADSGVTMRVYTSTGDNILGPVSVGGTAANGLVDANATVTALKGGGFVVSWTQQRSPSDSNIQMQVFSAQGTAVSTVVTIADGGASDRHDHSEIVALADGTFIALFSQGSGIVAQRFTEDGSTLGAPLVHNTLSFSFFDLSAVQLADGRIAVSYRTVNLFDSGDLGTMYLDVRDTPTQTTTDFIGTVENETIINAARFVHGGAGDDIIHERSVNGRISGGDGNDLIVMREAAGVNAIDGGAGVDWIDWSATSQVNGMTFDLQAGTAKRPDSATLHRMTGFENLIGTALSDRILGSSVANEIHGGAGSDTIEGLGGNDRLFGGDGIDVLNGGSGNDTLVGNADIFIEQIDTLNGGDGDDVLYGERIDNLSGGAGFDTLIAINSYDFVLDMASTSIEYVVMDFGNDLINAEAQAVGVSVFASGGNDTVRGSAFGDLIFGGVGDDVLRGGAGDDAIVGEGGVDFIDGGEGNDRLYIDWQDTMVEGGAGYDAVYITPAVGQQRATTLDMYRSSVEFVQDLAGQADIITAANMTAGVSIYAGGGSDRVTGGNGADVIYGEDGNDLLDGGAGNDVLVGGAGADNLTGGDGNDALYGGANDGQRDVFRFVNFIDASTTDAVYDFERGIDKLDIRIFTSDFSQVTFTETGGSTMVRVFGQPLCLVVGVTGMTTADLFVLGAGGEEKDAAGIDAPMVLPEPVEAALEAFAPWEPDQATSIHTPGRELAAWYL